MKKNKSFYGWLFVCMSLAIMLGVSVYLGATGWYFQGDNSLESDLVLGESVQVAVKKNQSEGVAFTFEGSYLTGEKLPQTIAIKNLDDEQGVFVRAKISVFSNDETNKSLSIIENVNWKLEADGYYYLTSILTPTSKANLCSHVVLDEESEFESTKNYIMMVIFETLSENNDVLQIWGVQPVETVWQSKWNIVIINYQLSEIKKDANF